MTSLTKVKALGIKSKRESLPPEFQPRRPDVKAQDIPPELCHLTRDALATPFPPIALGGYIKYYRVHSEHMPPLFSLEIGLKELGLTSKESLSEVKKFRRASSASMLGLLSSSSPYSTPADKTPSESHIFYAVTPENSTSPTPPPPSVPPRSHLRSQNTNPAISTTPTPPPDSSPHSRKRKLLSVIPEGSRETMRSEVDAECADLLTVRKPHAISSFTSTSTRGTLTTSSVLTEPPPRSFSLSPISPLRRRKRRFLRTPSVENDFARTARELGLGNSSLPRGTGIERQFSSGSESTCTGEESSGSPTSTVNTTATSVFDSSGPSSPVSPAKRQDDDKGNDDNDIRGVDTVESQGLSPINPTHVPSPSATSATVGTSDSASNPEISIKVTEASGGGLFDDEDIQRFVALALEVVGEDGEENRKSCALSYATARSSPEPPPASEGVDKIASTEV